MMTDDQITALAREYALKTVSHTRLLTTIADDTEDVIRFLLRRFCLVEKEAVRKQFESAKRLIEARNYNKQCIGVGSRGVLERLFPEIAKEVE